MTDGSFAGTKESLGGYWMIEVDSREAAIGWATRCPVVDGATIEVRQVQEFSDLPADVQQVAGGFTEMQARSK